MIYKYAHPEWFEGVEEPDIKAYNGNIIVHGTEGMGALAAHSLIKKGIEYICFTDNDTRKHGSEFFEHKVISPSQAFESYPDALVFIACLTLNVVKKQLSKIGFKELHSCYALFKEVDLDGFVYHRSNEYISRSADSYLGTCLEAMGHLPDNVMVNLSLYTTTRCTLRCKHCSQLIPFIKEQKDYDSDEFIKIVEILTGLGFYILSLLITTGEPFLYKDLHKLLSRFAPNSNIENIYIVTNATLLPDDKLLKALSSDRKIIVRLSDYGYLSTKLTMLVEMFKHNGIKYEVTNFNFWKIEDTMDNQNLSPKELKDKFDNRTCFRHSGVVAKQKLFICPGAASIELVTDFEQDEDAVLDFNDSRLTDRQIYDKTVAMLLRDEPTTACQYCVSRSYGEKVIKVPVAEQLEG
jgi:hypothetical protein